MEFTKNIRESIFVFDIETIPDTNAVYNLLKLDKNQDFSIQELREKLTNYHLEITDGKNPFHRQLFHKIVCISFLEAKVQYLRDGSEVYDIIKFDTASSKNASEEEIVRWFWNHCKKIRPKFISFNGKTFDLPVLRYRALKYDISCDFFFRDGDKWNNYISKYGDMHIDLIDSFSDFGASAKIKMSEICALLDIPCKLDAKGDGIIEMYDAGKIENIRDYCETDVLATYLLYLKFCHHSGKMNSELLKSHEQNVEDLLIKNQKPKIQEFLLKWKKN